MKNKLVIIPQSENGLISEVSENNVNVIVSIDIPYNSISKIINNETIVTLDKENKQLLIHTIDGDFMKSMNVPFGMAMNVKDSVVYVSGNARSGEVCYMVDLDSESQTLENIDLPEPMSYGKAVDDILILSNRMLLIDNIVYPKYTFEYDISMPNKPKWIKTIELPHGRPYENIIKGDMNEDWMIYLSTSSSGWTGDEAHITIEGKYCNTISSKKKDSILDISLIGDALYALTDIGLGYFDLRKPEITTDSIVFIEHEIVADRISKIDHTRLLLVSKYNYELLDLNNLDYSNESIEERFWSYGSLDLSDRELNTFPSDKIKHLEKLEHLDLSDNKLKEFPEALRACKKLRSLNLYNSGITEIPNWMEEFEEMEYLNLSGIDISSSGLFKLNRIKFPKNLKRLNLRYCQLLRIPPEVFKLKKLEYLNLKENMILWIPGKISKLKNLRTLEMDWSLLFVSKRIGELEKMKSLRMNSHFRGNMPRFVYHMKHLKRLDASSADIRIIAPDIKNLVNLEYLDLNRNYDLEDLPEEIDDLKNLRVLNLSVCGLETLPQSIHHLDNLEVLDLSHNHLTEVKEEDFEDMKKLRKLNLYQNEKKEPPIEIPEEAKRKKPLVNLPKYRIFGYKSWMIALWDWAKEHNIPDLTWSDLGGGYWRGLPRDTIGLKEFKEFSLGYYNNFTELPKEIGHLQSLTKIDFKQNDLEILPKEIGDLVNLNSLNLDKNKLKKLPNEIGKLVNLDELLICDNILTELPKEIGDLLNLTVLDVSFNRLKVLPKEIGNLINLKRLDVGGCTQLTHLPKEIGKLKNLIELDVGSNQLVELPKEIGNLTSLKELWIGSNELTQLPEDIAELTQLTKFCVSYNHLTGLPDMRELVHLTQLRLDSNQLTELPKWIGNLVDVTWLDLRDNKLKRLPEEITGLVKLETLQLAQNEDLILTHNQEIWIDKLKNNGCNVYLDGDEENSGILTT